MIRSDRSCCGDIKLIQKARKADPMNCPRCLNQTISFSQWKKARNAFRWKCPHCGAELKANRMVVVPFVIALILVIGVVVLCLFLLPEQVIESKSTRKAAAIVAAFLVAAPLGALSWFKGGYIEK